LRTEARRTLYYYLDVINLKDRSKVGVLANLTLRGCLILSETPYEEGTQLLLQIKLPRGGGLEEERLRVKGIVRWLKKETNRHLYSMGFLFLKKEQRTDLVVERLIDHIGFSDGIKKIRLSQQEQT